MRNHIHMLVEGAAISLSKIMQSLQYRYTRYYNRKYRKMGHLFQGRYKAILCERDSYLLELVRYIHLNPVRARLVKEIDRYPWSSHGAYLRGDGVGCLAIDEVLQQFSNQRGEAIRRYNRFIREGLGEGHREDYYQVVDQRFLGSDAFIEKTLQKTNEPASDFPVDIQLDEIVETVCHKMGMDSRRLPLREKGREVSQVRWMIAKLAVEEAGYRLGDVARQFRHPGVVSRGCWLMQGRMKEDGRLRRSYDRLKAILRQGRRVKMTITQA